MNHANFTQGRAPDVTLECMNYIRTHFPRAKISVEVEKPGRAGLEELADAADVVIYAKGWAQVMFIFDLFQARLIAEQKNGYACAEDCLRDQSMKTSRA